MPSPVEGQPLSKTDPRDQQLRSVASQIPKRVESLDIDVLRGLCCQSLRVQLRQQREKAWKEGKSDALYVDALRAVREAEWQFLKRYSNEACKDMAKRKHMSAQHEVYVQQVTFFPWALRPGQQVHSEFLAQAKRRVPKGDVPTAEQFWTLVVEEESQKILDECKGIPR